MGEGALNHGRLALGQIHRATMAEIGLIVLSLFGGFLVGISGVGFEVLKHIRALA